MGKKIKFNKIVAKYYDEVVEAGYHKEQKYVQNLLKIIPKNSNILELGCGTGQITIPLKKAGIKCECVDESKEMITKLKNKKIKIHNYPIEKFKPTKKYDYILSCNGPFQIKGNEVESYILEKEKLIECIKKFVNFSQRGLLINKDKAKPNLKLKLPSGKKFFHEECRSKDIIVMVNTLFDKNNYLGNINLIKRRYPKKEVLRRFKIKNLGDFVLIN